MTRVEVVKDVCCSTALPYCGYTETMSKEHTFVTVQSRGVVAIPPEIRRKFGLDQPGAQVEVSVRKGEIVLKPHMAVPADQAWFWSKGWQEKERLADEDINSGRIRHLESVDDLDS
ncbi:MAG: AbrB/MazE/SpoVT family DNA-binding domain-containing protein [Actinomycetota bacterium]|nr:MAG: AbrB/MazE/SpoVT family DNA-binding domain-containing protein [Actinomycetota bacterium]